MDIAALITRDPAVSDFICYPLGLNRGYSFKSTATVWPVMADQCVTCGAADVILFSCGRCGAAFCADHEPSDHSCSGLAHPDESVDEVAFEWGATPEGDDGFEWGPRKPTGEDAFAANGFRAAHAVEDGPAPRTPDSGTPAVARVPRSHDGDATPAVRPLPDRPDGTARSAVHAAPDDPDPEPGAPSTTTAVTGATTAASMSAESSPVRAMDTKRAPGRVDRSEPRTFREWLDQQTYLSLSAKTAALATLINGALYLGMFLTVYGLAPG